MLNTVERSGVNVHEKKADRRIMKPFPIMSSAWLHRNVGTEDNVQFSSTVTQDRHDIFTVVETVVCFFFVFVAFCVQACVCSMFV